jgi:hypothetical protein
LQTKHPQLNPSRVVFDPQVNFLQPSVHFFGKQHEASDCIGYSLKHKFSTFPEFYQSCHSNLVEHNLINDSLYLGTSCFFVTQKNLCSPKG